MSISEIEEFISIKYLLVNCLAFFPPAIGFVIVVHVCEVR